jgi:hypothetical protein
MLFWLWSMLLCVLFGWTFAKAARPARQAWRAADAARP